MPEESALEDASETQFLFFVCSNNQYWDFGGHNANVLCTIVDYPPPRLR